MGANKLNSHQEALKQAKETLASAAVPVNLEPEPDNPVDKQAIAFKCYVKGEWKRVGYVVKELTAEVHKAIANGHILHAEFAWIRFIIRAYPSGPGLYAGINITKNSVWSALATSKSSTL